MERFLSEVIPYQWLFVMLFVLGIGGSLTTGFQSSTISYSAMIFFSEVQSLLYIQKREFSVVILVYLCASEVPYTAGFEEGLILTLPLSSLAGRHCCARAMLSWPWHCLSSQLLSPFRKTSSPSASLSLLGSSSAQASSPTSSFQRQRGT